jgi:hypothetical protein
MPATFQTPSDERSWQARCRAEFGVTPRELGALIAIVAYHRVHAETMPLEELQRAAGEHDDFYALDPRRAPSALWQAGLIERVGPPRRRSYRPTRRGMQRVMA